MARSGKKTWQMCGKNISGIYFSRVMSGFVWIHVGSMLDPFEFLLSPSRSSVVRFGIDVLQSFRQNVHLDIFGLVQLEVCSIGVGGA